MNQAEWAISKVVRRLVFFSHLGFLVPIGTRRARWIPVLLLFAGLGLLLPVAAANGGIATHMDSVDTWSDVTAREAIRVTGVIGWLGRLHPLAVHFPIALVFVSGLAEVFHVVTRREGFGFVTRFVLYVASSLAVVSVLLGFAAATGKSFPESVQFELGFHRVMGIVVAGMIVLTTGLARAAHKSGQAWRHTLYRAFLFFTMVCVGVTAHTGATLVYGPGYLSIF